MQAPFSYDCFLSHNEQDKPRVRRLAERLRDAGLRVWLDEWVIRPGDDIYLAIERGLEESRVLVLCLSPAALGSDWVALERGTVLFRDPTNAGRRFVPLLLADCEVPDALRRYAWVDYRDDKDGALDVLIEACLPEPASTSLSGAGQANAGAARSNNQEQQSHACLTKDNNVKTRDTPISQEPKPETEPDSDLLAVAERVVRAHNDEIWNLVVSPDGTWMASVSMDKTVKVWDLRKGHCLFALHSADDYVRCVAITADGKRILSGWSDHTVHVFDLTTHEFIANWQASVNSLLALAPISNGDRLITAGAAITQNLSVWDVQTQQCRMTLTGHTEAITSVAVFAEETRAVSASYDKTLRVWDIDSGECLELLAGHSEGVNSVQATPDGRLVVSGSKDQTVKIWDLQARRCVGTLEGHEDEVNSVAVTHDGAIVASAGFADGSVRLWDWQTGSCLQVVRDRFEPVSLAFTPDGSRLIVGTVRGGIHIYRISAARAALLTTTPRRYTNAKVVVIGEGAVGKTSLAHRLVDDEYVVKDRTHGMNVWPLDLPLPPEEQIDREALLWDLAGQEDYRLIHRLFLDETALALLLINPQKADPFAEAGDWLKALETAAGLQQTKRDAARLLVFSQVDVGGMKLGDAKIERFAEAHGFDAWLATSAKTGAGCSDAANGGAPSTLKRLIAESIPWQRLPWTATPRLLAELKGAVMRMRDASDIRLLRFRELEQRLEQALPNERFDQADVRTAVTLLANHGLAMVLKFGDLVLLQPELLNGYAGAVIRAARAHHDEIGCVPEADIYDPGFDFTGVDRLPRPDEELLLRAMVQTFLDHSLCIAEDTPQGRQLVFPSQYRRDKDIPWEPDVFVSYTFGGEWQTIWTTLVVRLWYSQEFEQRELWRNAAEFCSSRGQLLGLKIDNRQGEGEATISLFFDVQTPDELKVIFIEYVHRHLARYGCDVTRDRRYVCTECGTPVTNLAAVRKRLELNKDFITCQICDERVPLIDFIEQRLKSDPVARKILAMEETATRALDTQALEQILIGHMMATCGEANQVFRPVTMAD
ncbi:TIR domain-containing protein [uncultured Thiohalocapsa sp.]|uniref:TIR domain-containing protein n=1 Tax=uncultured Thiohalocapsa sp. TaxID=768990 RepID=UPI0025E635B5|nr:TIR domain-containing protein [uncultured Thiohalocapsa sp.]